MNWRAVPLLCLPLAASPALAQGAPHYSIEKICEAAKADPIGSATSAYDDCMRDETRAREQIEKQWNRFSAQSRETCVPLEESESTSSYTYVLTCLQEENSEE